MRSVDEFDECPICGCDLADCECELEEDDECDEYDHEYDKEAGDW